MRLLRAVVVLIEIGSCEQATQLTVDCDGVNVRQVHFGGFRRSSLFSKSRNVEEFVTYSCHAHGSRWQHGGGRRSVAERWSPFNGGDDDYAAALRQADGAALGEGLIHTSEAQDRLECVFG